MQDKNYLNISKERETELYKDTESLYKKTLEMIEIESVRDIEGYIFEHTIANKPEEYFIIGAMSYHFTDDIIRKISIVKGIKDLSNSVKESKLNNGGKRAD